jgi:DNA-binding transcriptional regulator WhiA
LYEYLTPLTLATIFLSSVWLRDKAILVDEAISNTSLPARQVMFDSCQGVKGLKYLSQLLKNKYNIETEIKNNSRSLFVKNSSRAAFTKIVKPHVLHSQVHLFNKPSLKLTFLVTPQSIRGLATLPNLDSSRDSKRKLRKGYELSLEEREALVGIMLGDGYLHRPKPTNNTVLYIEQSYPEKEEYVNFLYKLLEPVVLSSPSVFFFFFF